MSELSEIIGHPAGVGELAHVGIGCRITEACFTRFSSFPPQSLGCTPQRFPVSPGGQPAPSCSCRRAHRTSCRSASDRAYTPPRGTAWYHCTLPGTPSASFQYPWYQLGHPTAGHKARLATQNSQAAPSPSMHSDAGPSTQADFPRLATRCAHFHPSSGSRVPSSLPT